MRHCIAATALLMLALSALAQDNKVPAHPYIKIETTEGDILVELDGRRAPLTVVNFLRLVDSGQFDGTIFHRVMPGFMIQGGGYTPSMNLKEPDGSLPNESGNGLSNRRGTIAMARQNDPHTAMAQFFINVADNTGLDPSPRRWGYTVFGNVIEGMEVVDIIANVQTGPGGQFSKDVPVVPIVIKKMSQFEFE
jgi:peptidyl-prolyl cis-trans isomerase A (cyclophilin A)